MSISSTDMERFNAIRGTKKTPERGLLTGARRRGWSESSGEGVTTLFNQSPSDPSNLGESVRRAVIGAFSRELVKAVATTTPSAREISRLRDEVADLRHAVETLASELKGRPVVKPATIIDLGTGRYKVTTPIPVVIEEYDNEVTATWPEVEAFATGDTLPDALDALKQDIMSLYDDLKDSPDAQLGPRPQAWKRVLRRVIIENGRS